jgi:hypothetical protein
VHREVGREPRHEFRFEGLHRLLRAHREAREGVGRRRPVEIRRHPGEIPVAGQVFAEAAADRGGREASAVEIEPGGEAVGVDHRFVAPGRDQGHDIRQHAGHERGPVERGMVAGPLD